MPSDSGDENSSLPRLFPPASDSSDDSSELSASTAQISRYQQPLFDPGPHTRFGDYRSPLSALNDFSNSGEIADAYRPSHAVSATDSISRINPVVVLPPSLEKIHSRRNGADSILAKLASLDTKPDLRTIDFVQESIRILSWLEHSGALLSSGLILPDSPRRFQVRIPQSPLVPIVSIAYPHWGKLELYLRVTEASGLVYCLKESNVRVRQRDPYHPLNPSRCSCVPVICPHTKDPGSECIYQDIPFPLHSNLFDNRWTCLRLIFRSNVFTDE